jgi:hypothetical protein
MRIRSLAAALLLAAPAVAFAHGGGLNADGCHNNRKTGEYHCHRPKTSAAAPVRSSAVTPPAKSSAATYFRNCDAARAAGAAPVRAGDPGYGRHLDRDGDGVGCE